MTASRLIRPTHIYLALLLAPRVLGDALSTVAMNQRLVGGAPSFARAGARIGFPVPRDTPASEIGENVECACGDTAGISRLNQVVADNCSSATLASHAACSSRPRTTSCAGPAPSFVRI